MMSFNTCITQMNFHMSRYRYFQIYYRDRKRLICIGPLKAEYFVQNRNPFERRKSLAKYCSSRQMRSIQYPRGEIMLGGLFDYLF
jgi:hypothetical protein